MLYVIGIGPGNPEYRTGEAENALESCELIVGYPLYLEFIKNKFPDREYYATPMTREIERCRYALEQGRSRQVALVCGGDAGVYGMAGPVLELAPEYPETEIRVIPGVTAALGGAAVLGAPLMHDFAVISLSDRLTPPEEIRKKLKSAAESDFVIALYNPSSKKRRGYLRAACEILLTERAPSTVCGYVRNVGRDDSAAGTLTLEELKDFEADMFTTIFVGNSRTKLVGGRMVTPRGYGEKIGKAQDGGTAADGREEIPGETAADGQENIFSRTAADGREEKILVAAGTTEGRVLCEYFARRRQTVYAFVATEYGEEMLPQSPYIRAETGRRDAEEMAGFLRAHGICTCYDAMHPYAAQAHRNLKEACERSGCTYTRVLREPGERQTERKDPDIVWVDSVREAAEFLKKREGNIFVTTGSRELKPFAEIENYRERILVRVLPSAESLEACGKAGFSGRQIIAMHGPFSKAMNELILREHEIRWMVTKDSGKAGGFEEKLEAARAAGAGVIALRRPRESEGITVNDLIYLLEQEKEIETDENNRNGHGG